MNDASFSHVRAIMKGSRSRFAAPLPRGLYAITPDEPDIERLLARCEAVLRGGAQLLQYRNTMASADLRLAQAKAVRGLAGRYGVPLIVNDDPQLARAVAAAGVHLGESDAAIAKARALVGERALIGVSCYNDLQRAGRLAAEGADYLAFGAFFPSPTKPRARRADPSLLADTAKLGLPRVAIGGVNADNAGILIAAGADLIAVVSALFDAPDPEAAARKISGLF